MNYSCNKVILFFVALLDFMGFTIGATTFPEMLISTHSTIIPHLWGYQARVLSVGIALGLYPLGQFLSASIFGALSDGFGRKHVLVVALIGTFLACLLTAVSIEWGGIYLLFLSRFLLGLFAGNVSVAQASMVDISDEKSKTANLSLIQLTLGLAWVFGAPLGSVLSNANLVSWFDYSTPFFVLALALLIVLLCFLCLFKETSHERKKIGKLHPLKGITLTIQAYRALDARFSFTVWTLFIGGWALFLQFLPLFLILNHGYTTATVGPLLAFMGGTFALTQVFISRWFFKRFKPQQILLVALIMPWFAVVLMTFCQEWWLFHLGAFLFPLSMGFVLPAFMSFLVGLGGSAHGLRVGQAQSIQSLMTIIVTLLGGKLLAWWSLSTSIIGLSAMCLAFLLFTLKYYDQT